MKGQNRVFEQVLLFGISVAIFVMCFGIFQVYQAYFGGVAANDQTTAIGTSLYNHMLELSRMDDMEASTVVSIPKTIDGDRYTVSVDDDAITVATESGTKSTTGLGLLSAAHSGLYTFSGEAVSSKGEIIIYKRGSNIIIE